MKFEDIEVGKTYSRVVDEDYSELKVLYKDKEGLLVEADNGVRSALSKRSPQYDLWIEVKPKVKRWMFLFTCPPASVACYVVSLTKNSGEVTRQKYVEGGYKVTEIKEIEFDEP